MKWNEFLQKNCIHFCYSIRNLPLLIRRFIHSTSVYYCSLFIMITIKWLTNEGESMCNYPLKKGMRLGCTFECTLKNGRNVLFWLVSMHWFVIPFIFYTLFINQIISNLLERFSSSNSSLGWLNQIIDRLIHLLCK